MAMTHSSHSPHARLVKRLDRFAMVLSGLCAVHCVVTPVLLVLAPLAASHDFEEGMRALLGGLAIVGVGMGTALHRSWHAVPWLGLGLGLLSYLGVYGEHDRLEFWVSLLASASLVTAHVLNSRACRRDAHDRAAQPS